MSQYQTNFVRGVGGNVLPHGQDLKIQIKGADVVTARLDKRGSFFRWKVIQIEQSGHRGNPEKDSVTLEMRYRITGGRYEYFEPGKYRVKTWYWKNNRGGSYTDVFEIE